MKLKFCSIVTALILVFALVGNSINVCAQDGGDIIGGASGDISGGSSVFFLRGSRKRQHKVNSNNSYFVRSVQSRNEERQRRIEQSEIVSKPINPPLPKNKAAATLVAAARKYLKDNNLTEAETGFYEANQLDPTNPNAALGLANVYAAYGDRAYDEQNYEKAILYYEKSNTFNPNNADTYASIGDAFDALKKEDKAISAYEKALSLNPKLTALYVPLGKLYYGIGNFPQAKNYLQKSSFESAKDAQLLYVYGATLYKLNEYKNALPILQKAVKVNSENAETHYYLGKVYAVLSDAAPEFQEKAIGELSSAAQLKPKYAEAYFDLGAIYYNRGDYAKAVENYAKAIDANSNYAEARLNLADSYRLIAEAENKSDNYSRAVNNYQIAVTYKQYTDDADVLAKFGYALGKIKDWTRAIEYLQKAVAKQPDAVNYTNLSWAFYGSKKYPEAVKAAQNAIARNQNFAAGYYNLGKAQAVLKNYDAAVESFKKALVHRANWTDAQINMGLVYGIKGDWQNAAQAQKTALETNPNSPEAHYFLAIAELNLGNRKDAERERDALTTLNPAYAQRINLLMNSTQLKRK